MLRLGDNNTLEQRYLQLSLAKARNYFPSIFPNTISEYGGKCFGFLSAASMSLFTCRSIANLSPVP